MNPLEAGDELARLLRQRDVDLTQDDNGFWHGAGADAGAAWECFREMAAMDSDEAVQLFDGPCNVRLDRLLYEAVAREQRGERPAAYNVVVSRQFTFHDNDDEYLEMYQVLLEFKAAPRPQLLALLQEQKWGDAGAAAAASWVAEVERSAPFTQVLAGNLVERFSFFQSGI